MFKNPNIRLQKSHQIKLNKQWHLINPMPNKPTLDQRITWHLEHATNCSCIKLPKKLKFATGRMLQSR